MVPTTEIACHEIFAELPQAAIDALAEAGQALEAGTGDVIIHQHDEAQAIYILQSGSVEFLIRVEGVDDLQVGTTAERGAVIGWSILRAPYRYTASIRCMEPCRLLSLPRSVLAKILRDDPRSGYKLLQFVAAALADRLQDALELLGGVPKSGPRHAS